jgi:hypothetical protein
VEKKPSPLTRKLSHSIARHKKIQKKFKKPFSFPPPKKKIRNK